MNRNFLPFVFLLLFGVLAFGQLPQPSFWVGSNFLNTSLFGTDSLGQLFVLDCQGNAAKISHDNINGYPALKIDSTDVFYVFTTPKPLGDNCLFLIVYETKESDLHTEHGLWMLKNGNRKKFLTSLNVGDKKGKVKYRYFFEAGPNTTTNLVHFKEDKSVDTVKIFPNDTIFIGRCDTVPFMGKFAEFLLIDKPLSRSERQSWQSYLCAKYGITMYKGDYLNSRGDTVWAFEKNEYYAKGVGGIGRDNNSHFHQSFSRIYLDSVKISLHNYIDNQTQPAQTPLQDGEYLFWGHNGGELTPVASIYPINTDLYNFYGRVWKFRKYHQNNNYPVDIQLNISKTSQVQSLKLFVGKDDDFTSWKTTVYEPSSIDNQKVTFSNITLPETSDSVSYFTFGYNINEVNTSLSNNSQNNTSPTGAAAVFTNASWLPNPVEDNLYIDYTLARNATVWFTVHQNGGIPLCQTPPVQKPAGINQTIIPMSHLITGTYTVYVHVDNMLLTEPIIKK
jgi:hypothetical protein